MILDLKKYAKNIILEIDIRLVELFKRYFKEINFSNITTTQLKVVHVIALVTAVYFS